MIPYYTAKGFATYYVLPLISAVELKKVIFCFLYKDYLISMAYEADEEYADTFIFEKVYYNLYKIPKRLDTHIKRFKEGRYSTFTDDKKSTIKYALSRDGKSKKHVLYYALKSDDVRHQALKENLSEFLDVDDEYIPEVLSRPDDFEVPERIPYEEIFEKLIERFNKPDS